MANYISNDEIAQAVAECNARKNEPTEGFCLAVKTIAQHLLQAPSFRRYSRELKEDMESAALLRAIKSIHLLRPEKNLFAYLTRICYTSFQKELIKYYGYENLKRELRLKAADQLEGVFPQLAKTTRENELPEPTTHQRDGLAKLTKKGARK